ncbi:MAG: flagellar motor switch protein FliM [Halanaerobiales bacterium]|nr:flagellar motor switch protein FliM [Halanaerobiales bacterium]
MADSEVLNQNEIDSLLSALDSGNVDVDEMKEQKEQEKVKKYDFRRPNKLSKEQMRTLQMIHENFARLLTTTLSTRLRSMVSFEVASIEQLSYQEFIRSLTEPTIISICELAPLEGQFIFEINPEVGFTIIDRLFGGLGKPIDKIRSFTDIEQVVLKKAINWILQNFTEAWENLIEIKPRLRELESNPQFTQIVPDNDMTIIITLSTNVADSEGLVNICIPYMMLEPIVSHLNAQHWFSSTRKEQTNEHIDKLKERVKKAKIDLYAELGGTELTVEDILYLKKGDIVKLNKKVDEPIDVKVGKMKKFKAIPGNFNRHHALKIVGVENEVVEEEGDLDE